MGEIPTERGRQVAAMAAQMPRRHHCPFKMRRAMGTVKLSTPVSLGPAADSLWLSKGGFGVLSRRWLLITRGAPRARFKNGCIWPICRGRREMLVSDQRPGRGPHALKAGRHWKQPVQHLGLQR